MKTIAPQIIERWKQMAGSTGTPCDIQSHELFEIIDRMQNAEKIAAEVNADAGARVIYDSSLSHMISLAVRLRDECKERDMVIAHDMPTVCAQIEKLVEIHRTKPIAAAKNLAVLIQQRTGRKTPNWDGISPDILDLISLIDHLTADLWPSRTGSQQPVDLLSPSHVISEIVKRSAEVQAAYDEGYRTAQSAAKLDKRPIAWLVTHRSGKKTLTFSRESYSKLQFIQENELKFDPLFGYRDTEIAVEAAKPADPIFSDVSQSNPKLHELYVNWAMYHLALINTFVAELDDFSNLNMSDLLIAVSNERRKLIMYNTAYRDAAARLMAGMEPNDDEIPMGATADDNGKPAEG